MGFCPSTLYLSSAPSVKEFENHCIKPAQTARTCLESAPSVLLRPPRTHSQGPSSWPPALGWGFFVRDQMDGQTDRHGHTGRPCTETGSGWHRPPCEAEAAGQEVETRVQRSVCGPSLGLTWPQPRPHVESTAGEAPVHGPALCSRPVLLGCAGTWPGWLWVAETRGAGLPKG